MKASFFKFETKTQYSYECKLKDSSAIHGAFDPRGHHGTAQESPCFHRNQNCVKKNDFRRLSF